MSASFRTLSLSLLACGSTFALRAAETTASSDLPPERLRFGSVSVYSENDKYFAGTDQHYTNGFKLSFLSAPITNFTVAPVPAPIRKIAKAIDALVPAGQDLKLGLAIGQNIYTPADISTTKPQPLDRPYCAWLYGTSAFQVYQPPRVTATGWRAVGILDTVEVTTGMVGPGALGRQVQNNVHSALGIAHAHGWPNEIHNEPGLELAFERKYHFSTPYAHSGWAADFIPHAGVTLGNIFTFANLGFEVRGGWCLPPDFGTNLIRPSSDSNTSIRPAHSVFAFLAFDGRAVARDVTLDGNTFRSSPSIPKESFVGDMLGGLAYSTTRWQFTYSQAERTKEFKGQLKSSVFGSISATFFY